MKMASISIQIFMEEFRTSRFYIEAFSYPHTQASGVDKTIIAPLSTGQEHICSINACLLLVKSLNSLLFQNCLDLTCVETLYEF